MSTDQPDPSSPETGWDWGNTEWDGSCWTVTNAIEEPVTGYHYRCQADARAVALPLGLVTLRVWCATKCTHPDPPVCSHCGDPITTDWLSNVPRPGQESVPIRFRHFDRRACRLELPLLPLADQHPHPAISPGTAPVEAC